MLAVRWTDEATSDLAEIVAYIEARNVSAAQRLHADIVTTVEMLSDRPFIYRLGRVAGTREALVRPNYLIVYQVSAQFLDVLRVLHTARQYP